MELFEEYSVSLVAVTQQLNTKNSMGRLTLNILLSFAQFEREIIAERTRDKMSAARKKGKWIGGYPVLGYDVDPNFKKLQTNEAEAAQVQAIYLLYLEYGSLLPVVKALNERNWRTKCWTTKKGIRRGGREYTKTNLYRLLTNVVYTGKICYQDEIYEGEHDRIIDDGTFQNVQKLLRKNGRGNGDETTNKHGAILRGLIYCDPCGCSMTHSTVRKNGKKYRYYVCQTAQKKGWDACPTKSLNAYEIENVVISQIRGIGGDEAVIDGIINKVGRQKVERRAKLISERKDARKRLKDLHVNIREVIGEISRTDENDFPLTERMAGFHDQVHVLEKRSREITQEIETIDEELVNKDELKQALTSFTPNWDSLSDAERGRILRLLINKIRVDGRHGNVTVDLRHQGFKEASREVTVHG